MNKITVGFIGAGGIAKAHAYALQALKFYYPDAPEIELKAVTSARESSRSKFAKNYGFDKALDFKSFVNDPEINTVFVLSPNNQHYEHLEAALQMKGVERIYLEKPICSTKEEEEKIAEWLRSNSGTKKVQIGFQFLFSSPVREALNFRSEQDFGQPIHFSFTYKHTDYLKKSYRDKRRSRLTPAPDGGAMADLGSHAISLLVAFLGDSLNITNALQGGSFKDVPEDSDLYSEISLFDKKTGAVGNLSASRISAGMGDVLAFDIYCEKGALRYNSYYPDRFEYCLETDNQWCSVFTGSNFQPLTAFPSKHVPGGWLRALKHAHYVFLTGNDPKAFLPGLEHGLEVQRLVRETADHLEAFRKNKQQ
ncbi:MAG: Gfo/Idh/MocA family oxidoreductase [Bacteroidales bacterium]|nr:Gfo/Idh/MocA family oxidoreductase [Bacteroidales bacterium]